MRCDEVIKFMQRDLDADLSSSELTEMNEHLHSCTECQGLYVSLKRLSTDLENLPDIEPPISFVDQILPQLVMTTDPDDVGTISDARSRERKTMNWKKWSMFAGGLAAAAFVWILSEKTFTPEMKRSDVQMESAANDQQMLERAPELHRQKQVEEKLTDGKPAPDMSIAMTEKAVPNQSQESKATGDQKVNLELKDEPKSEPKLEHSQKPSKSQTGNGNKENTSQNEVAVSNGPQTSSSAGESQEDQTSSFSAARNPSESASPPMTLIPEGDMTMNQALLAPAPTMENNGEVGQSFVSPNGQWLARLQANAIVVSDRDGLEVFRSHSWEEGIDVKVYWIDDNHLEYHLESTRNQTFAPVEPEIWNINMEERKEHKQ